MNLQPNELRIYYRTDNPDEPVSPTRDKILLTLMETIGYEYEASGVEVDTHVRELCFDRAENKRVFQKEDLIYLMLSSHINRSKRDIRIEE